MEPELEPQEDSLDIEMVAVPEATMDRGTFLAMQNEITTRWREFCEESLAMKIGANMNGMDLLILGGYVMADTGFDSFAMLVREQYLADHPELSSAERQLAGVNNDFELMAAQRMTLGEKRELRARLQRKGLLPKN